MSYKIKISDLKSAIYEAAMQRKSEYEGLKFVDRIFKENKDHIGKIKKIIKENKDNGKAVYDYLLNECGCSSKYDGVRDYMPTYEEEEILFDLEESSVFDDPWADEHTGETENDYTIGMDDYSDEYAVPDTLSKRFDPKTDNVEEPTFPNMDDERIYEEDDDYSGKKKDIGVYSFSGDYYLSYEYFKKVIVGDPMYKDAKIDDIYTEFYKDMSGEEPFTVNGKKYQFVWALYPNEGEMKEDDDIIPEYWIAEQMFEGVSKKKKAHMKGMSEEEIMEQVQMMEEQGYSLTAFRNEAEMNEYLSGDEGMLNEDSYDGNTINPYYKHFAVDRKDGKIFFGWTDDDPDDEFDKELAYDDIGGKGKGKIYSLGFFKRKGINPFDIENWKNQDNLDESRKKKLNEYNDNLPPGISDQDIEDYMGDADEPIDANRYPLIAHLDEKVGRDLIEGLMDDLKDYIRLEPTYSMLEVELRNIKRHGDVSTYDSFISDEYYDQVLYGLGLT